MDPRGRLFWGTSQRGCGDFGHLREGLLSTQPPFLLGDLLRVVLMDKKPPLWKRVGSPPGLSPWQLCHAQVTRAWPIRHARVQSGLWTREAGLGFSQKAAALLSGGCGRTPWWQGRGLGKDTGFPTRGLPGFPTRGLPGGPQSVPTGPCIMLCPIWRTRLGLCCLQLGILTHGKRSFHLCPEAAHLEAPLSGV